MYVDGSVGAVDTVDLVESPVGGIWRRGANIQARRRATFGCAHGAMSNPTSILSGRRLFDGSG